MGNETLEPIEAFESWLLRRVAQAVEAGEVPADLLGELSAEVQAARERPEAEGHAAAIRQIAECAGVKEQKAAEVLATIESQPTVTRELMMRRIAEAWLEAQGKSWGLARTRHRITPSIPCREKMGALGPREN